MDLSGWMRKRIFTWLPAFWDNPISIGGTGLTSASALVIVTVILLEWAGFRSNPYTGILVYLVLPALFIGGLILIPVGNLIWRRRRLAGRRAGEHPFLIRIELDNPDFQRKSLIVAGFTLLNLLIIMAVSYQAVTFMDSNEFCGNVCHTVMTPEYTSYQNSPHSRVHCVSCHIGSGANWFVKYKLSGIRQVYAVASNHFSRPIPTPVDDLRPARETCEQCHWPEKFHEDRIRVFRRYENDQQNTLNYTVLLMRIGGSNSLTGTASGIHWHTRKDNQIEYLATDRQRQVIPWVRLTRADGRVTEYVTQDFNLSPEVIAQAKKRVMDCVDCHNRPTHVYELPDQALDKALADGRIDSSLPFVYKKAYEALTKKYSDKREGTAAIWDTLRNYYRSEYPEIWRSRRASIESSVGQVQAIYQKNVFPEMNVFWGTYSNNLGHTDFPGCFRCHDDRHSSSSGEIISQDCETCHAVLAFEESTPDLLPEILGSVRE